MKEERKEGKKEGRKGGRKEGREAEEGRVQRRIRDGERRESEGVEEYIQFKIIYIKLKIIKQTKVSHSCDKSLFLEYDSLFKVSIRE